MIPVFDLHADLAEAIRPSFTGSGSVLKKDWMPLMKQGGIAWSAAASFFDGSQNWEEMQECVRMVRRDIEQSGARLILSGDELKDEPDEETAFLMTVEGMCGIHENPEEKIKWLYEQGNRIGSLAWNDQNDLATGAMGDPARGLTEAGKRVIRKMNDLHMIIDVSHANEKTFWDILDESTVPVIATHSNAKKLCGVERNLTNQQIRALAQKGGLIGMNACEMFISDDPAKRSAENLAAHARWIADIAGVQAVACGFDFGAYYGADESHNLLSPEQTQNFIEGNRKEGFNEEEIKDIAYRNVLRFLRNYM